jgi:hypothetical protein
VVGLLALSTFLGAASLVAALLFPRGGP